MPRYVEMDVGTLEAWILGRRLRERRKALRLSMAQICAKTQVTVSYISLVERGMANPSLDKMVELATAVDSALHDLVAPPTPAELAEWEAIHR